MLKLESLKKLPYFSQLGADNPNLRLLAAQTVTLHYERQQIIFLENEVCKGIYYLEEGRVRLFTSAAGGREQNLRIVRPGAVFNLVAALDGGQNPTSAAALEQVTLWHIPAIGLNRLVEAESTVGHAILGELAAEVRHLTALVGDLALQQVTARVAKLLLAEATAEGVPGIGLSNMISAEMTQQEIASSTGTVREMVGRALRAMQKEGAIQPRRGKIIVIDRERLTKFLE